jgi:hypothetical protein
VQLLLAGIRTDLDSFSDVEANALMSSAYRMTEHEFKQSRDLRAFPDTSDPVPWDFLAVEPGMKDAGKKQKHLKRILSVSGAVAFKVWRLSRPLKAAVGLLGALGWLVVTHPDLVVLPQFTIRKSLTLLLTTALAAVATHLVGKKILGLLRWRDTLIRIAGGRRDEPGWMDRSALALARL